MRIGNKEFDVDNHTYVMGILNVTPDSFSDGGKYNNLSAAQRHVEEMIKNGVDIIDVGGESTRPGYTLISDEDEIKRVVPVIEMIKKNYDTPISVDTYKSNVAKAALDAGADLINDIWGFKYDSHMAETVAEYNAVCCLMHNRNIEKNPYNNILDDIMQDMKGCINIAKKAGISDEKIILDPGIGFAKTCDENLLVMNNLEKMNDLGYPVLLGTSRKSMIGITLDLPVDERVEGTIATTVIGVMKKMAFVRVHDVKANLRAIKMTEAIIKSNN